ncbi:UNVERIFIED_ORG: hypothetical protein ABID57_000686 [Arthrobacter sp. UYEF1]
MIKTGIFATPDEIEALKATLKTPVIMAGGMPPPSPQKLCHDLALKHGLPEIKGFYGITGTGEFVKVST